MTVSEVILNRQEAAAVQGGYRKSGSKKRASPFVRLRVRPFHLSVDDLMLSLSKHEYRAHVSHA